MVGLLLDTGRGQFRPCGRGNKVISEGERLQEEEGEEEEGEEEGEGSGDRKKDDWMTE